MHPWEYFLGDGHYIAEEDVLTPIRYVVSLLPSPPTLPLSPPSPHFPTHSSFISSTHLSSLLTISIH